MEGSQSFLQGIFCMRKEHEQDTQAGAWPRVLCRWNWDRGNRQAPRKEQAGLKRNVAFTMRKGLNTICSHAMEHDHGCKLILTVSQKNLQRQMGGRRPIGCSCNIQREIMFCRKERTHRAPGGKGRTLKITGLRNQNKRIKMRPEFLITVYREDGYPGSSDVKESACNAGDPGSITGSGRSPGEGNGNPLQYSCLQNFMNRGTWWATVHGVAQSRTRLSD